MFYALCSEFINAILCKSGFKDRGTPGHRDGEICELSSCTPLQTQDRVMVVDLANSWQLNGDAGLILDWDPCGERWIV